MKVVILCAGYATRLQPLTLNKAKALLPIANRPIIDYLIDKIPSEIDIIVVSNQKFFVSFQEWAKKFKLRKITILNDLSSSNDNRLGGVGDLMFAIDSLNLDDDLLVLLGDNIFDFDLSQMIERFNKEKKTLIGVYDVHKMSEAKKLGVVSLDSNDKLNSFEEKPMLPRSTLCSVGVYIFKKENIDLIRNYMDSDAPKDGPGFLIKSLIESEEVYAHELTGRWFDIGSLEIYKEVQDNWI